MRFDFKLFMKQKLLLFFLFFYAFAKIGTAQTSAFTPEDVAGVYGKGYDTMEPVQNFGEITQVGWKLTLSPDGRFEYHNFRKSKDREDEHWKARGNWTFKKNVVFFTTAPGDINETYFVDLNNSKARFFKKSPRNKSLKPQPTYIHFFESDYNLTRTLKLPKINE